MRKHLAAVAAFAVLGLAASARAQDTIKTGMIGCTSESLLNEALGYAVKKDMASLRPLLASGECTVLRAGSPVGVIDAGYMVATLRYRGIKIYAPAEVLR
jgi:hypothetical protein